MINILAIIGTIALLSIAVGLCAYLLLTLFLGGAEVFEEDTYNNYGEQ